ncbi:MAG TPA: polyhydroxyalkanoic acid system family protein [Rhodanobacter sp.]|jgi:putative polyhydroxyalkanoate system protein|nr:polyhydroxyalkanoic acid system family protein [Rhodanobacter sp.]
MRMDDRIGESRNSTMLVHRIKIGTFARDKFMPSIDIRRPHQLSIADARTIVDQVATRMHEKFGTTGQWRGDTLEFSRTGVSGSIAIETNAIQVRAQLSMMLAPLKGMIEQEIRRKLDEHFV